MRSGTTEAFYAWPYFEALNLETLTPEQQVELLTLVTAGDYDAMLQFGGYNFYRVHISPDGTWRRSWLAIRRREAPTCLPGDGAAA